MQHSRKKIIEISSIKEYEQKKKILCDTFIENIRHKSDVDFTKKTSNLFRERKTNQTKRIDVSNFNHVISIDTETNIATIEAMIRFEDLVTETLKHGFLPPVVPQLKTITLGGAISGVGIEASSFKYGLVHEAITEMEVMLADGKIVVCTPDNEYKDLFFALPNSYGTLGYILKVKMPLVKTKKYVKTTHHKYSDAKEYFRDLETICREKKSDFVDGVSFDERTMYIITGSFTNSAPYTSNYKYLHIFYKSILKRNHDFFTTCDFIWRWDTDWFWCSKIFFMQNPILRLLLGKFMLGSESYWAIARFEEKHKIRNRLEKFFTGKVKPTESIVQDVCIPIENCQKFLEFFNKNIGIKPVWICPSMAQHNNKYTLFTLDTKKLYVDFGFWDIVPTDKPTGYYNKLIEAKVEELGGKKSLYSESYYEKDRFWKIYNGEIYHNLKKNYDPSHSFSDLFTRCVKNK